MSYSKKTWLGFLFSSFLNLSGGNIKINTFSFDLKQNTYFFIQIKSVFKETNPPDQLNIKLSLFETEPFSPRSL